MSTQDPFLNAIPADVRDAASRIAATGRILIQEFVPAYLLNEAEKRLFLSAIGEIQKLREGHSIST